MQNNVHECRKHVCKYFRNSGQLYRYIIAAITTTRYHAVCNANIKKCDIVTGITDRQFEMFKEAMTMDMILGKCKLSMWQ